MGHDLSVSPLEQDNHRSSDQGGDDSAEGVVTGGGDAWDNMM